MVRSKLSSSMQKTYDECYLICSTAVYFEGQNNEAEALRSWHSALDTIYYYNAYRVPSNYLPKTETEKALQESIRDLEVQCKERVDLLEALLESRREMQDKDEELDSRQGTSRKLGKGSSGGAASGTLGWIGEGTIPALDYLDLSRPPPIPTRPMASSRSGWRSQLQRSSNGDSSCQPPAMTSLHINSPGLASAPRAPPRGSSPEKRKVMLTTLRQKDPRKLPKSKLTSNQNKTPVAASMAAGLAWNSTSQTPVLEKVSSLGDAPILLHRQSTLTQLGGSKRDLELNPISSIDVSRQDGPDRLPSWNWKELRHLKPSQGRIPPNATCTSQCHTPYLLSNPAVMPSDDSRKSPSSDDFSRVSSRHTPPSKRPPKSQDYSPVKVSSEDKAAPSLVTIRHSLPQNVLRSGVSSKWARMSVPEPSSLMRANSTPIDEVWERNGLGFKDTDLSEGGVLTSYVNDLGEQKRRQEQPQSRVTPASDQGSSVEGYEGEEGKVTSDVMKRLPRGIDTTAARQVLNDIVVRGDEVHWDDIAGLDVAKNALKETVVYPFLRPDLFMGLREPAKGMLLFGPPGTGKTMLARAVATESKSTFFSISASSLTSKWHGESEKLVRALFGLAKSLAPSIIFVDEIDSLLSARSSGSEHEASRRSKTEFLIQWSDLQRAAAGREQSGWDKKEGDASRVLVLAATNMPWDIDEAARRRFVRRQYIPLPENRVRDHQLRKLLSHQNHELSEDDIKVLVGATEGFSGSDITALAKDAAMGPLRNLGEALLHTPRDQVRPIRFEDFEASLYTIRPSVSQAGLKKYEAWAKEFGERGG